MLRQLCNVWHGEFTGSPVHRWRAVSLENLEEEKFLRLPVIVLHLDLLSEGSDLPSNQSTKLVGEHRLTRAAANASVRVLYSVGRAFPRQFSPTLSQARITKESCWRALI
jgi:hypothetical protein